MTYPREQYEEVTFQVIEDEDGALRSGYYPTGTGTVDGNVAVDFVWGNVPLQPDEDRTDDYTEIGGGEGDNGWDSTSTYTSDNLPSSEYTQYYNNVGGFSKVGTINNIALTGHSNFPAFIPNYAGDGDTELEVQVPNLIRKTIAKATDLLDEIGFDLFAVDHVLTASYIETTGKTVRVTAYDTDWDNWGVAGTGYENSYLNGLRVGDQLNATLDVDGDDFFLEDVVVTKINLDGENSWFEYKTAEAISPALDIAATGTILAGANLVNKITLQRSVIRDEGQQVNVRYFND